MPKKVLITGATSGIGEALTYLFAEKGYELVLLGRSETKLSSLKQRIMTTTGCHCQCYCVDFAKPNEVLAFLNQEIAVNIFIHCAGIGVLGDFQTLSFAMEEKIIAVNVHASLVLLKKYAQQFARQGHGVLVAICSTAAFYPHPFLNSYAASKAFLFHYCLGLSEEMTYHSKQVKILALSPGPTKTPFFAVKTRAKLAPNKLASQMEMTPAQVAKQIIKLVTAGNGPVTIGMRNKASTFLLNCLPLRLRLHVVGRYLRKGL